MLDAGGCCDRCAGSGTALRIARRRLLRSALFSPPTEGNGRPGPELARVITGTVLDVSPQFLVIGRGTSSSVITLSSAATAWRGGQLDPPAVQPGDRAVIRLDPARRNVANRVWANIGRVTGTIAERSGLSLLVDEGLTRRRQVVGIPRQAAGRIQVRFPNLDPGYLIDVIGLRRGTELQALIPATAQPAYRASRPIVPAGHVPDAMSGSATWHEPASGPPDLLGLCYPAIDPDSGCAEHPVPGGPSAARLPYLAVGSMLVVRNDCTGASCTLPVTGCSPVAGLFHDRCVTCGTSPRGRVADLTLASYVALGGEPETGCFNATIAIGH
jgi:hypothetical protein